MLLLCLCKRTYTVAHVRVCSYACIIYASAIFGLYSLCAYGQYRTTSLVRSWQHRYGQDVSFYSGSNRPKHVGGMPLEGKLRLISHTHTCSLYPWRHSRDVLDKALPSFSGGSKVIQRESLGTRLYSLYTSISLVHLPPLPALMLM